MLIGLGTDVRRRQDAAGYLEVNTPEVLARSLWETSGHWEKFGENMYLTQTPDERVYAIKPMNCPGHILIYKTRGRSYRELPMRWAELGTVYRYERSGVLHGMLRVRGFTLDDADEVHEHVSDREVAATTPVEVEQRALPRLVVVKSILDVRRHDLVENPSNFPFQVRACQLVTVEIQR